MDIAKERLESGVFKPSDPSWELVIRYVLSGYGYSKGVLDTFSLVGREKPTEADLHILKAGYALSSAYLKAQGEATPVQASQVFTQSAPARMIAAHVAVMNQTAASVPADVHALVGPVCQIRSLSQLSAHDSWWAHERFWAAGGVINPGVPAQLRTAFTAFRGTPMGFLNDLATKLDAAMRAIAGVPTPQVVEDLVLRSQQILLTLAAGTPNGDNYSRLNPTSAVDWQIIRKALFLALSVTRDADKGDNKKVDTFLRTLFDCGQFYPAKTAPDAIKTYYWKLEALNKSFTSIWNNLRAGKPQEIAAGLAQVLREADPLHGSIYPNKGIVARAPEYPVLRAAYEQAIELISPLGARFELATAIVLYPKLNFQAAFKTLYPDLTTWAEYHTPSKRAEDLVGAFRAKIAVPEGTKFEKIHLKYSAGKWHLIGQVNWLEEKILWQQGASASQAFIGELKDDRGTHLFSFRVDSATATIKAMSSGYLLHGRKRLNCYSS